MKYYAVFTKANDAVEVVFPDIEGCHAFGFDLADAYSMAFEELCHHLPKMKSTSHLSPTPYEEIRIRYPAENQIILPFTIDPSAFDRKNRSV